MRKEVRPINRYFRSIIMLICASLAFCAAEVRAAVEEAAATVERTLEAQCGAPFADNAVLQQKMEIPVWGTSLPGASVTVSFDGQSKQAVADGDGKWRVFLAPMDAVKLKSVNHCPEGKTMTITCEKDGEKAFSEIRNIIIGDVWICAGQSNMAGSIKASRSLHWPTNTIDLAVYPALRRVAADGAPWTICSPETVGTFGKVSFFFARRLQQDALVPVGLIRKAVGGSSIESWLNQKPYETGGNYSKLMAPHVGYGIRGVIWYQGESNANDKRGYQPKLESLITGWREAWGQGDFPFYYVQLPGIGTSTADDPAMGDGRAEIRQACVEALALKNTGLAVTIDVGAPGEHPPNKYDTGDRLARAVLRNVYGQENVPTCPLYKTHKVEGDKIRVSFDYAESGLMLAEKEGFPAPKPTPGAKLAWLSIQGKDGVWHWADGQIDGSELVVSCQDVPGPVAVRYAYTIRPVGPLLYNKDGLPVGPFSTIGYGPELKTEEAKKGKK